MAEGTASNKNMQKNFKMSLHDASILHLVMGEQLKEIQVEAPAYFKWISKFILDGKHI